MYLRFSCSYSSSINIIILQTSKLAVLRASNRCMHDQSERKHLNYKFLRIKIYLDCHLEVHKFCNVIILR